MRGVAFHAEDLRERRLDAVDQLTDPRNERREAVVGGPNLEQLDDERVARLRAPHSDRAGGGVDPLKVDLGDQVGLAADLAGEAIVRLERDDRAGLDLEHGRHFGGERPDDLVAADPGHGVRGHQCRKWRRPVTTSAAPAA
jgi:hypothetical protein